MNFADLLSIIQTVSIVIGILVAVYRLKDRGEDKAGVIVEMRTDIRYIKDTVSKLESIPSKMVEVELSLKNAHEKINGHLKDHREGRV